MAFSSKYSHLFSLEEIMQQQHQYQLPPPPSQMPQPYTLEPRAPMLPQSQLGYPTQQRSQQQQQQQQYSIIKPQATAIPYPAEQAQSSYGMPQSNLGSYDRQRNSSLVPIQQQSRGSLLSDANRASRHTLNPPSQFDQQSSYGGRQQDQQPRHPINSHPARGSSSGSFQNVYEMSKQQDSMMQQYTQQQRNGSSFGQQGLPLKNASQVNYSRDNAYSNPLLPESVASQFGMMEHNRQQRMSQQQPIPNDYLQGNSPVKLRQSLNQSSLQNGRQPSSSSIPFQNPLQGYASIAQTLAAKPVNPKYQDFILHDQNLAAKDKNTALYKPAELMNLDLKTDGSPIGYKPEYHQSSLVNNNIFPSAQMPGVGAAASQDPLQARVSKVRTAMENRRKAKQDNFRRQRLKNILAGEL
ncbi:hypothetical protein FGO68_gene216 [Halteria grandinella]|uniref:Uncharacterized protein n=1 Tax=Halteria grandinella TaxID=5974 RepID=A0A8J8NNR4_HALGN|nr:hypothetical protein FGO68_gene216 [Halteria grandinella]